jgi:ribosomal protein S18 acetylase RimI-like enzyme
VRIWRASPGEAADVARLLGAFRDSLGRAEPDDASVRRSVEAIIPLADTEYLLGAPGDGPPAGVVGLRFRHTVWTDAEDCWIEDVFVEESARGGGLGRALVEAALARARERGCVRVDLDTQADNTRAIRLYESLGFHAETALLYMRTRL